ncbi:MAG TPA: 3'-5' exonuclease [Opitutaceae bacterium]|nr:3'-5' exonuclease [Opitutaceae bacterium]
MKLWPFRRRLDPLAAAYRDATPRRVPGRRAWNELRFLVLDAETTGFNIAQDRLLSLATMPIRRGDLRVGEAATWVVQQPTARVNAATTVHGLLPADLAHGAAERDVLAALLPQLHGAIIIGHHIGFDCAMIDEALRRHFNIALRNPRLDTAALAMRTIDAFGRTAYPGQRPPTLEELCAHCDIPPMDRHTAAGDTFTTAELFLFLCARLRRRLDRPLAARDLPIVTA